MAGGRGLNSPVNRPLAVRPSSFAVLRLIVSRSLVACSTGRSLGLAPWRILSMYSAPRAPVQTYIMAILYEINTIKMFCREAGKEFPVIVLDGRSKTPPC